MRDDDILSAAERQQLSATLERLQKDFEGMKASEALSVRQGNMKSAVIRTLLLTIQYVESGDYVLASKAIKRVGVTLRDLIAYVAKRGKDAN